MLPEGCRAFLTRLGNGGAGPYYGLLPLERCAASGGRTLSRPSPLWPRMPCDAAADALAGYGPGSLADGAITLIEQGCAYSSLLIVTGPHRGAVVNIDPGLSAPPYFARDGGFLAWYERWLDELPWGWDGTWFGFGLPGREPELAEALLAPPYADRGDALRTLARIPALSDATLAAAGVCLGDEDASVRAAATSLLGRHRGAAAAQLITRRLMDPDPAVRSAALQALAPDHAESTGCYRAALADPSPDVVHAALRMLADNGHLDEGDLAPLLSAGSPAVHRTAIWYLGKTPASPCRPDVQRP